MRELTLAVVGLFSVICAAAIGVLTWLASRNAPAAILAGLTATGACFGATVQLIATITN